MINVIKFPFGGSISTGQALTKRTHQQHGLQAPTGGARSRRPRTRLQCLVTQCVCFSRESPPPPGCLEDRHLGFKAPQAQGEAASQRRARVLGVRGAAWMSSWMTRPELPSGAAYRMMPSKPRMVRVLPVPGGPLHAPLSPSTSLLPSYKQISLWSSQNKFCKTWTGRAAKHLVHSMMLEGPLHALLSPAASLLLLYKQTTYFALDIPQPQTLHKAQRASRGGLSWCLGPLHLLN